MQKRIIIKTEHLIILIHNMHFSSYSFSCGPIKAPWCMIRHERIYKVCVCDEKKMHMLHHISTRYRHHRRLDEQFSSPTVKILLQTIKIK